MVMPHASFGNYITMKQALFGDLIISTITVELKGMRYSLRPWRIILEALVQNVTMLHADVRLWQAYSRISSLAGLLHCITSEATVTTLQLFKII